MAVTQAGEGISRRGTGDAQVVSGDVLRKLLVQMAKQVEVTKAGLANEDVVDRRVGRVRPRDSRRAAKGCIDARDAQVRGCRVAQEMRTWYSDGGGPSLLASAQLGHGRRLHIVDCTKVEVPLDSGHYECSGVVQNADGSLSRGYKLATRRPLLDTAGVLYPCGCGADAGS